MDFTPRILKNPPIREAIYTITFQEPIAHKQLSAFLTTDFVKEQFPIITPGLKFHLNVNLEQSDVSHAPVSPEGYTLIPEKDSNRNRLIQIRPTFLSYHNMNKYDGWDTMIKELKSLWEEFCKSVGVGLLADVRVRNINNIELPLPLKDGFKEYIKLLPHIPPAINPAVENFFIQLNTNSQSKILKATVSETIAKYDHPRSMVTILLDITVSKPSIFQCNQNEMWEAFNELREFKDDIFFGCITEKTENIFNHE